jgi:uncharacterized protein (DUF488 family)
MIADIIQNTQLQIMHTWNNIVDVIAPHAEKREAIRVGMSRVNHARGVYRELDKMLTLESRELKVTHIEERKLLKEKQTSEVKVMSLRHKEVRSEASEQVRKTRSFVLSGINGSTSVTAPNALPA